MSTEQRGFCDGSQLANADLSTKQYCYVKNAGAGLVDVVAASTDTPIGVLQNKPTAGNPADIMITGRTKVLAGAAVAAGADLMPDATGRAITLAAAAGANRGMGKALTAAAAAGVMIEALLPGNTTRL